jgi:hypothetical protein
MPSMSCLERRRRAIPGRGVTGLEEARYQRQLQAAGSARSDIKHRTPGAVWHGGSAS